jgi:hypothetical protein
MKPDWLCRPSSSPRPATFLLLSRSSLGLQGHGGEVAGADQRSGHRGLPGRERPPDSRRLLRCDVYDAGFDAQLTRPPYAPDPVGRPVGAGDSGTPEPVTGMALPNPRCPLSPCFDLGCGHRSRRPSSTTIGSVIGCLPDSSASKSSAWLPQMQRDDLRALGHDPLGEYVDQPPPVCVHLVGAVGVAQHPAHVVRQHAYRRGVRYGWLRGRRAVAARWHQHGQRHGQHGHVPHPGWADLQLPLRIVVCLCLRSDGRRATGGGLDWPLPDRAGGRSWSAAQPDRWNGLCGNQIRGMARAAISEKTGRPSGRRVAECGSST